MYQIYPSLLERFDWKVHIRVFVFLTWPTIFILDFRCRTWPLDTILGKIRHHGANPSFTTALINLRVCYALIPEVKYPNKSSTDTISTSRACFLSDGCMATSCGRHPKLQYCTSAALRHADSSSLIGCPAWITWPSPPLSSGRYSI